jgi:hypothetical protein
MRTPFAFVCGALLVLSASAAGAQGTQLHKVVVSKAAMRAMVAHKPTSKSPFTARVGMTRRSSGSEVRGRQTPSTSVRQVTSPARKK